MTSEFRFAFPDENALVFTGATARFRANVLALTTLKELEETREEPTPAQLDGLSRYTGWGDTQVYKQAFPDGNYHDTAATREIEAVLSKAEQLSVSDSILNAHYTSLPIIKAMYDTLLELGMVSTEKQRLRILEPAGGAGNFIGMMPDELRQHSKIHVVEMDQMSCRVMEQLYPECYINNRKLEDFYLTRDSFDLVISNIPFGQETIFDPVFVKPKYLKRSIHDYYFARAIQAAKPGGIIAFITSRYTLDKENPEVRKFLAEHTELLAITRLPSTTFRQNAGTDVVTDILFLRKKTNEEKTQQYYAKDEDYPEWVNIEPAKWLPNGTISLNARYVKNPRLIAGTATTKLGQHYMRDFTVEPPPNEPIAGLAARILQQQILKGSYQYLAGTVDQDDTPEEKALPTEGLVKNPLKDKSFTTLIENLYTQVKGLLEQQSKSILCEKTRAVARGSYDNFRDKYGAINSKANLLKLEGGHPCLGLLRALEEPETHKVSAILTGLAIRGEGDIPATLSATDALSICLNRFGQIEMDFIASMMEQTEGEIIAALQERLYLNIEGEYQLSEIFLSGNVRKKLQQLEQQFPQPTTEQNRSINALRNALPKWIIWENIGAKLGSPWIPCEVIEQFIEEVLSTKIKIGYIPELGSWNMSSTGGYSVECKQTWGTNRVNALELIENGLNLRTPKVYDKRQNPDSYVLNQSESLAAQAKLSEIKLKFIDWLATDAERIERLEKVYNETHNNFVEPAFDGSHLTLPGLSLKVTPRPHQKDMVWRNVCSRSSLAAHEGGAGKTGEAIMTAMELRRMGLAKKPVVVVPNGLTAQWADEARMFYPAMKVYAPDKEGLSAKNRALLLARIATGDFDLLILPYTAMKALPMKAETMRAYIIEQISTLEEYLREDEDKTNKQIKRAVKSLKAKLETINSEIKRDDERNITFEETGIDFLIIDEAHNFKNLFYTSKIDRVAGMPNTHSQRAFDLFLKTQFLRKKGGRISLLTATPVSNSIVETYTMMRYTMLEEMKDLGVEHFDAWVQTWAETAQTLEMKPDCSGFRMVTRLSKFSDLPELRAFWSQTLDIKTAEQLKLQRPEIIGGKPEVVTIAQSPELKAIIQELAVRTSNIDPRTPEKDNMLLITTDGRKAALDVRLYRPYLAETDDNKMKTCARKAAEIYREYESEKGTQLIFCDIGTPRARELKDTDTISSADELKDDTEEEIQDALLHTSFYEGLRQKLIRAGIPAQEIVFIHEAKTAEAKARLFGRMKRGEIRILIGSTSKCGVGMNAQDKVIAIHHLDSPWRPTDIDQRNWRGLRPGNQFKAIHIFVYITEQSFDAYTWGILENKMRSITQLMAPVVTCRTAEDISEVVLDAAQIKALASGNPKILEKVATETELARLEKILHSWQNDRQRLRFSLGSQERSIGIGQSEQESLRQFIAIASAAQEVPIVPFKDNHPVNIEEKDITSFLTAQAEISMAYAHKRGSTHQGKIAEYQGMSFELLSVASLDRSQLILTAPGIEKQWQMPVKWTVKTTIQNCLPTMQEKLAAEEKDCRRLADQIAKSHEELSRGWRYAEQYQKLQEKLFLLNEELTATGEETATEAHTFIALDQEALTTTAIKIEPVVIENTLAMAATANAGNALEPFAIDPAFGSQSEALNPNIITEIPTEIFVVASQPEPVFPVETLPAFQPDTLINGAVVTSKPGKRKGKANRNENQLSLFG